MRNITVFVPAKPKPIGKNKTVKVGTGQYKDGFFGQKEITTKEEKWEQTGWSDKEIDGYQLQEDLQVAINDLNNDGFEVVSVSPITSGNYNWEKGPQGNIGGYGYGYGYSYTEGMLIVAKKV
ncbi:hypothetical protein [Pseudoalteromonas sp. McH1-7]|uniref:hypothetical protein n=1 Tax=Pseudoalteromonas sp. McH1-7 TaxID=2745574 RepID=UPI001C379902|nr:hypothetical protein [Pseudoalteromonas sp. McH1-7]